MSGQKQPPSTHGLMGSAVGGRQRQARVSFATRLKKGCSEGGIGALFVSSPLCSSTRGYLNQLNYTRSGEYVSLPSLKSSGRCSEDSRLKRWENEKII